MPKTKDAAATAPSRDLATTKPGAKPEVDVELEGLMSEIESDIREEEFKKLWKRYGSAVIAFAVAVVLGVLAFQLYRQYEAKSRTAAATRYEQAQRDLQAGKLDEALAGFKDVAASRFAGGYSALSRLGEAQVQLDKKDEDGAVATYTALAADTQVDPAFRDLATLLRVQHSLDHADPKSLEALLAPLTAPNNAFNASALELSALLAAKEGDLARAREDLDQVLADPNAPPGVRQRATDLAALYKDQSADAPATPTPVKPPAPSDAAPAPAPNQPAPATSKQVPSKP